MKLKRKIVALSVAITMIASIGISSIAVQAADFSPQGDTAPASESSKSFDATSESSTQITGQGTLTGDSETIVDTGVTELTDGTGTEKPSDQQEPEVEPGLATKILELSLMVSKYDEINYTAESWQAFQPYYNSALAALVKEDATLEEIDQAIAGLKEHQSLLIEMQDLTEKALQLSLLINGFEELNYTEESWQAFKPYYDSALVVSLKEDATLEEIEQAMASLEEKQELLVEREIEQPADWQEFFTVYIAQYEALFFQSDFTAASWNSYYTALVEAKSVVNHPDSTADDMAEAVYKLNVAAHQLEVKNPLSVPAYLAEALSYAEKLTETDAFASLDADKQDTYQENLWLFKLCSQLPTRTQYQTDSLWFQTVLLVFSTNLANNDPVFVTLLANGADKLNVIRYDQDMINQVVALANKLGIDATPVQVRKAATDLINVVRGVHPAADTTGLTAALNKANGIDRSKYTDETVQALDDVREVAQALLDDQLLSVSRQDEVDAATQNLYDAIDALKLKETPTPEDPKDPAKEGDKKEDTKKENNKTDNQKSNSPKTSDMGVLPLSAVGFTALALGGIVWAMRKKYEE